MLLYPVTLAVSAKRRQECLQFKLFASLTNILCNSHRRHSRLPLSFLKFKHVKKIIKRMCDDVVVDGPSFEFFFTFFFIDVVKRVII